MKFKISCFLIVGMCVKMMQPSPHMISIPLPIPPLRTIVSVYEMSTTDPTTSYEYMVASLRQDRQALAALINISTVNTTITNDRVFTADEYECMAKNIYFEARNQSIKGKIAIALVTLRRTKEKRYPNNICDVVHERKQFSWYWDNKSDRPQNKVAYQEAILLTSAMLSPELNMIDFTDNATHYHADPQTPAYAAAGFTTPAWANDMLKIIQVDVHIFYH